MGKINNNDGKLIIKNGTRISRVNLSDVLYVEYRDRAAYLKTKDKATYVVEYISLSDVHSALGSRVFARCHKSFLVNKDEVKAILRMENAVLMGEGGIRIALGRKYKQQFYKDMGL